MSYGYGRHSRYNGVLELIGAFAFAGLLTFAVPGLLLVFAADRLLSLWLARDQLIVFGLSASALLCGGFVVRAGGFWRGVGVYLGWSLLVAWLLAVGAFGFHATWVYAFARACWP